jgi:hypothetical protein
MMNFIHNITNLHVNVKVFCPSQNRKYQRIAGRRTRPVDRIIQSRSRIFPMAIDATRPTVHSHGNPFPTYQATIG